MPNVNRRGFLGMIPLLGAGMAAPKPMPAGVTGVVRGGVLSAGGRIGLLRPVVHVPYPLKFHPVSIRINALGQKEFIDRRDEITEAVRLAMFEDQPLTEL